MKTPLLLLHGALGTEAQFDGLISTLEERFEIHRFNFSGHGGTDGPAALPMSLFAKNIEQYITDKRLKAPDVFGYSMGGYAALYLASLKPQSLGRILTLGTKFDWTPESAAREGKMLIPEKIEEKVPKFAALLSDRHGDPGWKTLMRETANMMKGLGNGEALSADQFQAIQNKVRISLGTEDNMVSREESEQVAGWLPNGTFQSLDGVPHPIEKVPVDILSALIQEYFIP